jgi:hypothetical protein
MLQFAISGLISFVLGVSPATTFVAAETYRWAKVAEVGSGCFAPKCREGQFAMAIKPIEAFDGKLYVLGEKEVWISEDGTRWRSQPKTDWGQRYGMQFAYFQGKLWMLGGMRTWDDFRNDVWSSDNGMDWKQVASNAPWSKRRGHSVVVFNDRLWVIGGSLSSGFPDKTPTEFANDIWSSADGIDWRLESGNTPLAFESGLSAVVFRGQLLAIGGTGQVWSSRNGKDWKQIARDLSWAGNGGSAVHVFDEKLWVLGGINRNAGWSSADGKKWVREFSAAPWSKRNTEYSVVFKDKLWLFSGKTGRDDSWDGAVWAMSRTKE